MSPAWLADGRRLIFAESSATTPIDNKLYILDTHSRKCREIFRLPQGYFLDGLAISPDNRTIYFPLLTIQADLWLLSLR